eukprot:1501953-Amphidinium_carterae.1
MQVAGMLLGPCSHHRARSLTGLGSKSAGHVCHQASACITSNWQTGGALNKKQSEQITEEQNQFLRHKP